MLRILFPVLSPLLLSFHLISSGPGQTDLPCKLSEFDAVLVHNDAILLAHREVSSDTSAYYNDVVIPEKLIHEYESVLKEIFCAFPDTVNNGNKNHFWESYRTDYFYYATLIITPLDYKASDETFLPDDAAVRVFQKNKLDPAMQYPDFFKPCNTLLLYKYYNSPINHGALLRELKNAGSRDSVTLAGNVMETDDDLWSVVKKTGGHEVKYKLYEKAGGNSNGAVMRLCVRTFFVTDDGIVKYVSYQKGSTDEVELH